MNLLRYHLSLLPHVLTLQLLIALPITLRLGPLFRISALVLFAAITVNASFFCTSGNSGLDFIIGAWSGIGFFTAFHLLWLEDPFGHNYRHETDGKRPPPEKRPFLERFFWVLCIQNNLRGVGWSYQVPNIPPRPSQNASRWSFVRVQLLRAFYCYLLNDLSTTYTSLNPLFHSSTAKLLWRNAHYDYLHFTSQGPLLATLSLVTFMYTPYTSIVMRHAIAAAVCVATGLSEPKDWPDIIGSLEDCYTVRRVWGRAWHQLLRRFAASIGKTTARKIGFKAGTYGSSYTQLYIGFLVSAIPHSLGDIMVDHSFRFMTFQFLMVQALAIHFEDTVIAGAVRFFRADEKMSPKTARRIGYVWVTLWYLSAMPLSMSWHVQLGLLEGPFTFSVIGFVLRSFRKSFSLDVESYLFL